MRIPSSLLWSGLGLVTVACAKSINQSAIPNELPKPKLGELVAFRPLAPLDDEMRVGLLLDNRDANGELRCHDGLPIQTDLSKKGSYQCGGHIMALEGSIKPTIKQYRGDQVTFQRIDGDFKEGYESTTHTGSVAWIEPERIYARERVWRKYVVTVPELEYPELVYGETGETYYESPWTGVPEHCTTSDRNLMQTIDPTNYGITWFTGKTNKICP